MGQVMLKINYEGHLGIEKCKRRAREYIFWPNMNQEIEQWINRYSACQKHQYQQQKEPLIQRNGTRSWQIVGTDLFHYGNKLCRFGFPF